MKSQIVIPIFLAALQVLFAAVLFLFASLVYRWPFNALPGFYLIMAAAAYGLTVWAYKAGKASR